MRHSTIETSGSDKDNMRKFNCLLPLGSDGSGVVCAVGDAKNEKWLNQEVIINPNIAWGSNPKAQDKNYQILGMPTQGTLAEYLVVDIDRLVQKPTHLNLEQSAAIPLAGLTAFNACFNKGNIQKNQMS